MPERTTSEKHETPVLMSNTPSDEWRVMNPKENKRAPKHTTRFICAKAGSPKSCETHGDGTPIRDFNGTTLIQRNQRGSLRRQARVRERYPRRGKVSGSY